MKNRIITALKKQWLTIWSVVVAFSLLGVMIASADYPAALPSMKRVIASTSEYGMKFSSNILMDSGDKTYSPAYKDELLGDDKTSKTYDVEVNIWNYSLKNPMDWYKNSINYTLGFALADRKGQIISDASKIGDRTVTIYKTGTIEPLITLNSSTLNSSGVTLATQKLIYNVGNSDSHTYTFKYDGGWDLDGDEDICVQMIATPTRDDQGNPYNDLSPIGAVIGLKRISSGDSGGWTAYLNEHQNSNITGAVDEYDGYNLVVTGSGTATITIIWNTAKFEMNKYFRDSSFAVYSFGTLEEYDASEPPQLLSSTDEVQYIPPSEGSTFAALIITANSGSSATDRRTRYNIQVYKTGSHEPIDWQFFGVKKGNKTDSWYNSADIKVEIA